MEVYRHSYWLLVSDDGLDVWGDMSVVVRIQMTVADATVLFDWVNGLDTTALICSTRLLLA